MKRTGVLNIELSSTIASLGHGDRLVIADAGLPIPKGVPCIDLAVALGIPSLKQVLDAVLEEVCIEQITLATATEVHNPQLWQQAHEQAQQNNWHVHLIDHEAFKMQTTHARAVVRTGDNIPYTNIILHSGVPF